jgi:hypothetical protein
MIRWLMPRDFTSGFGLGYNGGEIAPFVIHKKGWSFRPD